MISQHDTPEALLARLRALGFRLTANGGRLNVAGPAGKLTPDLREQIAAHKPALLALLAAEAEEEPFEDSPWLRSWGVEDTEPDPAAEPGEGGDELAHWFLTALAAGTLPTGPVHLGPGLTVSDPAKCWGFYRERLEAGQMPAETTSFLKRLRRHLEGQGP